MVQRHVPVIGDAVLQLDAGWTRAASKPPSLGAATSFQISSSRLSFGWVMYS